MGTHGALMDLHDADLALMHSRRGKPQMIKSDFPVGSLSA